MSKKNKWKVKQPAPVIEIERAEEAVAETTDNSAMCAIPIDKSVKKLLEKTATRNKIEAKVLIDIAVQAMVGSVESYGYNVNGAVDSERKATVGAKGDGTTITISKQAKESLNAIGIYFGAKVADLLQDAIMGQRYNWQRMQPVNARSMSSIRMEMFRLEQLGPRA